LSGAGQRSIRSHTTFPLFFGKVIYRRYASLFFIVGTKPDVSAGDGAENTENELGMLEFIHNLVETMDKWAGSICEVRDAQ
jgi:AP-4 complex subunit sigma-1